MENTTVYEIVFEYSTEDCSGIDTYIYGTRDKALEKLKSLIEDEKAFYKNEYSHIDQEEFEIDTNIEDTKACEFWWNIQCKVDWYLHTNIDLRIKGDKLVENHKYGYKISYKEFGKRKVKIYLVINTLDGAIWSIRWYQTTPQFDRKDNHEISKPFWFLEKVKNIKEYNKLWKGCPFKDDLS